MYWVHIDAYRGAGDALELRCSIESSAGAYEMRCYAMGMLGELVLRARRMNGAAAQPGSVRVQCSPRADALLQPVDEAHLGRALALGLPL